MTQTLYDQLVEPLMAAPDKPLMITEERTVTCGEFLATSRRLACYLRNLDLEPGGRVVVQVEKSPEAVMLYVACLQAGLVIVPLNTTYTANEIEYFLRDAAPGLVICTPEYMSDMTRHADRCGVRHVESLGPGADGTLMRHISRLRTTSKQPRAIWMISQLCSIRPEPPADRRAPC